MNERIKKALENVKNIKVGCMVLNDLFGEELSIIEKALNNYEENEKELIAEQHRLFDLAKEKENELALLWKPIKEYFEEYHDWVLVQFKEKDTDFMPIPVVAEYRKHKNKWFSDEEDNSLVNYYNDMCEPIAFMEIPHYKEQVKGNKIARLELNKKELYHLQNDVISQIYDIKKSIFGNDYDFGCKLSDKEKLLLTKEKEKLLKNYGYYSRLELKEKLDKFENDNFAEIQSCEY